MFLSEERLSQIIVRIPKERGENTGHYNLFKLERNLRRSPVVEPENHGFRTTRRLYRTSHASIAKQDIGINRCGYLFHDFRSHNSDL
jgi:hypothetical protein